VSRVEFSRKQRLEMWTRAKGHCEGCGMKLKAGQGEYDHVIAYEISRDTSISNGQLLCTPCHRGPGGKTADDAGIIAKVRRIEAKHRGTWPPSKAPLRSRGFASTRGNPLYPVSSREEHDDVSD
jgi:5-methylcytosine-specific restriction protein A